MRAHLDGARVTDREIQRALGIGNSIRYGATTGTLAIRWEGARAPVVWEVEAADISPAEARNELARRYLHVFGPTTADGFARWAGISRPAGAGAFAALAASTRHIPPRAAPGSSGQRWGPLAWAALGAIILQNAGIGAGYSYVVQIAGQLGVSDQVVGASMASLQATAVVGAILVGTVAGSVEGGSNTPPPSSVK